MEAKERDSLKNCLLVYKYIYVLVIFDVQFLGLFRLLGFHKIQRCIFFLFKFICVLVVFDMDSSG